MRRFRAYFSVVAIVLLGAAIVAGQPGTMAQEGTPEAVEGMMPEGLTFTLLGFADGLELPSPAVLEVARSEFEPGAGFPFFPGGPTGALVIVESGSLTARVEEQSWTISRGAALQEAMAAAEAGGDLANAVEQVAAGAEGSLQAGDVAFVPGGVSGEVRNDGEETASALLVLIAPSGVASPAGTPGP
jgi:quercetin dioxygenase-like cupin family protein